MPGTFSKIVGYLTLAAVFLRTLDFSFAFEGPSFLVDRRTYLWGIGGAAAAFISGENGANAVISSKYCASGKGEGCNDLADGNEFIRSLQEKSAANAEVYARDARNAYYMKNYPDVFAVDGKKMLKKSDGTFVIVSEAEMKKLLDENRIGLEFPKAMGGKVTDLTQKPILTLRQ